MRKDSGEWPGCGKLWWRVYKSPGYRQFEMAPGKWGCLFSQFHPDWRENECDSYCPERMTAAPQIALPASRLGREGVSYSFCDGRMYSGSIGQGNSLHRRLVPEGTWWTSSFNRQEAWNGEKLNDFSRVWQMAEVRARLRLLTPH